MDKILEVTRSPEWWFTAVVVGLVVGVAGTYAVRVLDRFTGNISTFFSTQSTRAKQRRDKEAGDMLIYPHRVQFGIAQRTKYQLMAVLLSVIGCSGLSMAFVAFSILEQHPMPMMKHIIVTVLATMSYLMVLYGLSFQWKANDINLILADALKRLDLQQDKARAESDIPALQLHPAST